MPRVSPDGRKVAFRSQARDGYESDVFRLKVLDLGTGAVRTLGGPEEGVDYLTWSPDGTVLAFLQGAESRYAQYGPDRLAMERAGRR